MTHVLLRTQDLPPVLEENSCLYLFSRESLERHGSRHRRTADAFELPRDEAWDIDDEVDFRIAEALYLLRATAFVMTRLIISCVQLQRNFDQFRAALRRARDPGDPAAGRAGPQ